MHVTTKGRHAVRAMIDLASYSSDQPSALPEIGRRQRISVSYLEQLFTEMKRAGLLKSTRGPGGGYSLARSAETISVEDIIRAVDGKLTSNILSRSSSPADGGRVFIDDMWEQCTDYMLEIMRNVSLASISVHLAAEVSIHREPKGLAELTKTPVIIDAPISVFDFGARFLR